MNIELERPVVEGDRYNDVPKKNSRTSFFTVILIILAAVLVFSVVSLNIKTDEVSDQINAANIQLKELGKAQADLQERINDKLPVEEAIDIAVKEYEMVNAAQLPQMYVSVPVEDKGQVMEKPEDKNTLRTLFSAIGESLSSILEYMQG